MSVTSALPGLLQALDRATARGGKRPSAPADVITLNLAGTQVTDAGLKELKDFQSLQTLDLRGARVTDAGLKELKGLHSLQLLNLQMNKVTEAGVQELQQALPHCQILYGVRAR